MRILIVKLSSLGDVIQTLPILHDLSRAVPQVKLDWVIEEAFASLLQGLPGLDRVLVYGQRRWRKRPFDAAVRAERRAFFEHLRQHAYDVVIDAQGLIKSAWVARQASLAPGGFSVTFGNRSELCSFEWPVRLMLNRSVPMPWQVHAVQRTRLLAAGALSYERAAFMAQPPVYPFGPLAALTNRTGVWLSHGTTRADNQWPRAHWLALARRLIEAGESVLIPQASATEAAWAHSLTEELGPQAQVLPRLQLGALWPQMAHARGVVSVDSGLGHLAVALDLPVVQLFSQDRIRRAGPIGRAHQMAIGGDHVPDVDEAWQAWQRCLSAASPARQRAP
jgi:heptosyltransferase-1